MIAKISGFLICVEVIIYLLLDDLHDCTFIEFFMENFIFCVVRVVNPLTTNFPII